MILKALRWLLNVEPEKVGGYLDSNANPVKNGRLMFFSPTSGKASFPTITLDSKGQSELMDSLIITKPTIIELYTEDGEILWSKEVNPA